MLEPAAFAAPPFGVASERFPPSTVDGERFVPAVGTRVTAPFSSRCSAAPMEGSQAIAWRPVSEAGPLVAALARLSSAGSKALPRSIWHSPADSGAWSMPDIGRLAGAVQRLRLFTRPAVGPASDCDRPARRRSGDGVLWPVEAPPKTYPATPRGSDAALRQIRTTPLTPVAGDAPGRLVSSSTDLALLLRANTSDESLSSAGHARAYSGEVGAVGLRAATPTQSTPVSVETVLEELYERLQFEFLRCYGTSEE